MLHLLLPIVLVSAWFGLELSPPWVRPIMQLNVQMSGLRSHVGQKCC